MKKIILFLLFFPISFYHAHAGNEAIEAIKIGGVENPVCFAISPDGLTMIIVDEPRKSMPIVKLSHRPYIESSWSTSDRFDVLNRFIKEGSQIDAPFFSHDGEKLFFSANFEDSKGGMDIYFCNKKGNSWSDPMNLGAPINSVEDENSPSITANNRTFFFTRKTTIKRFEDYSTGEMWKSEIDSTHLFWLPPQKLDRIINNGGLSYPKISDDNKTFFFSRLVDDKLKWQLHWVKRFS